MVKKFRVLVIIFFMSVVLSSCGGREKLLVLNWGEYINEEAVALFEKEYNVDVIINIVESNEMFYSKIKSGTTVYDLVVPSDYMVDKLVSKDLIQKIDFSLLSNYDEVNNPFLPGVIGIQESMFNEFKEYTIPYFWGTFGLMYNKKVEGLEEAIQTYSWKAFFEEEYRPKGTKVAMYNVPRFAYATAMFYNDLSPNLDTDEALGIAYQTLSQVEFSGWGTDTLKKSIVNGNLDLAFVYTGDFLDMLYIKLADGLSLDEISFDIYIPDNTIAFMDSFVIPKKARHYELAHKFMDFFLRPEIAYMNASVVGYCTPLLKSYEAIVSDEQEDRDWAYANKKYYPILDENSPVKFQGTPLKNMNREFLAKIDTMINNVKAKR